MFIVKIIIKFINYLLICKFTTFSKHIVIFTKDIICINRKSITRRNNSLNYFITNNICISISFTKSNKIKISSCIKQSIFSNIFNYIKNLLSLCRNIINITLIKFLYKSLNIQCSLRIKLLRVITSINPILITLLNTSSYFLLYYNCKFLTKFSITCKNYFCIISTYNKVMRILNILANISTNNTFHKVIITHSSRKTSIFFISSIIRIKYLFIKFIRYFALKNTILNF